MALPKVNKFGSANVSKVKIEYYKEPLRDIKYVMSFCSHDGFNSWINMSANTDKVVTQMLICYRYDSDLE